MNSNGENFDNSLDSALNMSQDEIEKLINGHFQMDNDVPDYEAADLDSLLSELESMDDGDIQEISDLLDKADNNEAVDQNIMNLLDLPDEPEEIPAYEAVDLFSADEQIKEKNSFFKRLVAKFTRTPKKTEAASESHQDVLEEVETLFKEEESEETTKQKKRNKKEKKEKKKKKKKKDSLEEATVKGQEHEERKDTLDLQEDALNGSDAIILELEKEEQAKKEEQRIKESSKKKVKSKKKKDVIKKKNDETENSEEEPSKQDKKKPKEKKVKVKKEKEKSVVLYDFNETPMTKKKVSLVFFVCIMLMLAVLAFIVNFAGYRNKRLAEEAYEDGNYLQCYQLLYGQHLSEGQEVLFHKSKINLKVELLWNRYHELMKTGQDLRGLDRLVQFVFGYPKLSKYAEEWNCEELTESTYQDVLSILYTDYKLLENNVISIANISDDLEYTKTLSLLVEKKKKGLLKYPNMLPEEEERIENSQ